jgi:hypothetical protein
MPNSENRLFDESILIYTNQFELARYLSSYLILPVEYRLDNAEGIVQEKSISSLLPGALILFKTPLKESMFSLFKDDQDIYPVMLKIEFTDKEAKKIPVKLVQKNMNIIENKSLYDFLKGSYYAAIFEGFLPFSKVSKIIFRSNEEIKHFLAFISAFKNVYVNENLLQESLNYFHGDGEVELDKLAGTTTKSIFHTKEHLLLVNRIRSLIFLLFNEGKITSNNDLLVWHLDREKLRLIFDDEEAKRKKSTFDKILQKEITKVMDDDKFKIERHLIDDAYIPENFTFKELSIINYLKYLISPKKDEVNIFQSIAANISDIKYLIDTYIFMVISKYLLNNSVKDQKDKKDLVKYLKEDLENYILDVLNPEKAISDKWNIFDNIRELYFKYLDEINSAISNRKKYSEIRENMPNQMNSIKGLIDYLKEREAVDNNESVAYEIYNIYKAISNGFNNMFDKEKRKYLDKIILTDILISKYVPEIWPFYDYEDDKYKANVETVDGFGLNIRIGEVNIPVVRINKVTNLISNKIKNEYDQKKIMVELEKLFCELIKKTGLYFDFIEFQDYFLISTEQAQLKWEENAELIVNQRIAKYNRLIEVKSNGQKIKIDLKNIQLSMNQEKLDLLVKNLKNGETNILDKLFSLSFDRNKELAKDIILRLLNLMS